MKKITRHLLFIFLILENITILSSQNFDPIVQADQINEKYYAILQFKELPNLERKQSLAMEGIRLYDYLGGTNYLACFESSVSFRNINIFSVSKLTLESRSSDEIRNGEYCNEEINGIAKLSIQYLPELDINYVSDQCKYLGIFINKVSEQNRLIFIECKFNQIQHVLKSKWIQHIECTAKKGEPEDREGRSMHRVNQISGIASKGINLDGEGVNVLVRDDGPVGPHIDFNTRLINQTFGADGNHGDGVSGIICGAANIDPLMEGMAPAAKLYVINYQDDFLDNTESLHKNSGVVVTNSSYSNGCNGGYTIITQIVDRMSNNNPTLLHCFSAGNSNNLDCGYGAGNQWGNITGGHKIGKNVITAANLTITGVIDGSSSRGPTKDGRLKPDVSSRGTNENSTDIGNTYQVFGGTSAASPGVAGTAVLLYQAFKNLNNQNNPNSALIKATLMNTATDLGTQGPDYVYGFGVIDGLRAYNLIKEHRYQEIVVKQNDNLEIKITVPTNSSIARFMIYWAEKESSLNARKVLINDIDMEVLSPTGTKILPWVLNPTADANSLAEGALPGVDTLNNFEQVAIQFPQAGEYTIIIKGKFIPDNSVPTYFLYDFPENKLNITSPVGHEKFNTLETTNIYYNSYNVDTILIELSIDGGLSWRNVKSVLGNTKLINWITPNGINSDSCIIRLTQNNITSQSEFFTITNPITGLKIDKYCPDELTLTWSESSKDSFLVYSLQGPRMNVLIGTDTNIVKIPIISRNQDLWFAVAGYRNGVLGRRTKAINISDTLVKCQVANDLSIKPKNEWLVTREFVSCGSNTLVNPEVIIHNRNINEVNSFAIKYYQGNNLITEIVNRKLKYRDSILVKLNGGIQLDFEGEKTFTIWIELSSDEFAFNDTTQIKIKNYLVKSSSGVYPMVEDFEANKIPNDWLVTNSIPSSIWQVQEQLDKNINLSKVVSFSNSNYSYAGSELGLVSKLIDLNNSIEPYFYMDFAYHKSNYFAAYYDTLSIEVLELCSGTTKSYNLFSASETSLYTSATTPDIVWVPTESTMWKTLAIDLSIFKGKRIAIKVKLIRGVFSNLYLDNIKVIEKLQSTPTLNISWEPNELCISNIIRFSGSSNPSGNVLSWNFGLNATPRTGMGSGPLGVKYTTSGPKVISLSTNVGNQINIVSRELNTYQQSLASFDYIIKDPRLVSFFNFSTNTKDVLWDFGDGNSSTELNPIHQFDSAKIYKVNLMVSNPCGTNRLSLDLDLRIVGVNDLLFVEFDCRPNPSNGIIEIYSESDIQNLEIFNTDGKIIFKRNYLGGERKLELDLSKEIKGIYLVKLKTNSSIKTKILILD
ncbi:MAG: S8 family serine peptidase [Saprospiraceae bacterium]